MKRWLKYVKPYLGYFIFGPVCMIIEVVGEMFMPILLANIINSADEGTLTIQSSIITALLMALLILVMMAGGVGGAYFGAKASVNFATDVRHDVYSKIQRFSFSNIDKFSTGSLVTRLTNDVTQLQNFCNTLLRMALRSPGMMIGGIVMAVSLKPSLSVVLAVSMVLLIAVIATLVIIGFPRFGKVQTKIDALNSTVRENVTNVRVVKSFVREEYEIEKFEKANSELKDAGMSAMKIMLFISPIMTIFMYGTIIAIIWFGHGTILDEIHLATGMKVGDLSAFITYVRQILSSLMMVTFLIMVASRAIASAKRIGEVLDEKVDLTDENAAYPEAKIQRGEIEFCGVSFRYYKNNQQKVLDNINLKIEPGATVGIIGSTGCGKTTLVSMIPRLYDVDEGAVLIDGINVKDYSLFNLREGVGMVLQKNLLFSGTISENLRWGDFDATDEELKKYSEYAAADKFISTFGDGYETLLDKGGTNLSGGQKQRVCIARTLLKKPKILIFDDSTSAVDTATERQIRYALANSLPNCTKIIIAQRISSVRDAEQIIVLDDGVITGIGTHEELLNNNVEYAEIYYSQMDKKEEQ